MEQRLLGGSGSVPVLSLARIFSAAARTLPRLGLDRRAGRDAAHRYLPGAGLNMFDSADIYSKGLAEEVLGKAIAGRRDKVIVSTARP
jgi:aryl-alcohol dehydrogenase-like predicted oxidoreductase